MDLKITKVHNHGNANEEFISLEVLSDCDVGKYTVSDSTYISKKEISNKLRHTYWFPDLSVKKGDAVVLRTGYGTNASFDKLGGGKTHIFYWNLKSSVWNNEGDVAIVMKVAGFIYGSADNKI